MRNQNRNELREKQSVQQEMIRSFFREIFPGRTDNLGAWIIAGFMEVCLGIFMMVPCQEILLGDRGFLILPLVFGLIGPTCYLSPYYSFTEEGKKISIHEKLKYLPVDERELRKMRVCCLFRFTIKIFPVFFVMQVLVSWAVLRGIRIENILYAVCFGFLWPFLSNLPMAAFQK